MSYTTVEKVLLALTLLAGTLAIFTGITFLADGDDGAADFGSIAWGVLAVCVGGMILVGVYLTNRRPWLWAALVSGGAIAIRS